MHTCVGNEMLTTDGKRVDAVGVNAVCCRSFTVVVQMRQTPLHAYDRSPNAGHTSPRFFFFTRVIRFVLLDSHSHSHFLF